MRKQRKKKQVNNLVTKNDLKRTERYLEYKIEVDKAEAKKFREEFVKFKNYVYDKLDWLVGAFQKFNEEHTILSGKYSEVNEKLDNHENRISVLEKKTHYSS